MELTLIRKRCTLDKSIEERRLPRKLSGGGSLGFGSGCRKGDG
jgi:hypothetical protein